jgi:hypothetical protein
MAAGRNYLELQGGVSLHPSLVKANTLRARSLAAVGQGKDGLADVLGQLWPGIDQPG